MSIQEFKSASREEWRELRRHYIGGSDAAAVVGMNKFTSAYELWCIKTGKKPEFEGNLATEVGTYLEDFVAGKFTEQTGKKVRRNNRSLVNDKYPWAIANIDREIVGEDAGLEIKTTSALNLKSFKNGEYPENYYVQCMHYLAITNKKKWHLAVLIGNKELKLFTIVRDEDEIKALMNAERDFWALVKADTPPAPDGSESASEAISAVYPESNDTCVDLGGFNADLCIIANCDNQIKELKQTRDEAANRIKAFMGEAGRGESEKFRVSWKTVNSSRFDAIRFAGEHPELAEEIGKYYKHTTSRAFKISAIN